MMFNCGILSDLRNDIKKHFSMRLFYILLFIVGGLSENSLDSSVNVLEESPVVESHSAVGREGFLPCNLTAPNKQDSPLLIIVFRGSEPIYSIDARNGELMKAIHWTSPALHSRNPSFVVSKEPHGLILPSTQATDEGDYHCRVDFIDSPTRNLRVKLFVAVPPSRISIIDGKGEEVHSIIGPYPLGDTLTLTCIVSGGRPRPKVTWWYGNSLLDEVMEEAKGQMTTNSLTFPNLTKNHLGWKITCQAVNSNLTNPVMVKVQLDMTFPPSEISIEGSVKPVNEGTSHQISCRTTGSRPSASITWWKDGELMKNPNQDTKVIGNFTKSTISIIPSRSDDGSIIACRAENPLMTGSAIEDTRKLIVYYPPRIHIQPGSSLNLNEIKEGEDVYFECLIKANPKVFRIEWMHNSQQLKHRVNDGIIVSNQSLVLQKLKRTSTGEYSCRASNTLGKATSSSVYMSVKYEPSCGPTQQEIYGSGLHSSVNITCDVEGEPKPNKYYWSLNTSNAEMIELPPEKVLSFPGRSILMYEPKSYQDFGTLFCWGENSFGKMVEPCTFQVVPASPPEIPKNCTVSQNATVDEGMITVYCIPGWDGGLPQTFSLEVRLRENGPVIASLNNQDLPTFSVRGVPAGKDIFLTVVATSHQGESAPLTFPYFTPIDIAEERLSAATSSAAGWSINYVQGFHFIGVVIGVLIILGLGSGVLVMVVHTRAATHAMQPKAKPEMTTDIIKDEGGFSGPDVILVTAEESNSTSGSDCQQPLRRNLSEDLDPGFNICPSSTSPNNESNKLTYHETDVLLSAEHRLSQFNPSIAPNYSTLINQLLPQTENYLTPSHTLPIKRNDSVDQPYHHNRLSYHQPSGSSNDHFRQLSELESQLIVERDERESVV